MDDKFKQEYLCEWNEPDPVLEAFVEIWMAYHNAAYSVDGHLPPHDHSLNALAVKAGSYAMESKLKDLGLTKPPISDPCWERAKKEALRRIERGLK